MRLPPESACGVVLSIGVVEIRRGDTVVDLPLQDRANLANSQHAALRLRRTRTALCASDASARYGFRALGNVDGPGIVEGSQCGAQRRDDFGLTRLHRRNEIG